jgi:hypothetical protein
MKNAHILAGAFAALTLVASPARADDEVRRVVTGLDNAGKSVALFDSELELRAQKPGRPLSAMLWVTQGAPAPLSAGEDFARLPVGFSPPPEGTKFLITEFPPTKEADDAKLPVDFMMKTVGKDAPAKGLPPRDPMMHRTRTVDYAIVMSGKIDMLLDSSTLHLKAGDIVVQQATNHAWVNHGSAPARVLFVLMDSKQP